MTNASDGRKFLNQVVGPELLDSAIEWIGNNLTPDDVFSTDTLNEWARDNDYKKIIDSE